MKFCFGGNLKYLPFFLPIFLLTTPLPTVGAQNLTPPPLLWNKLVSDCLKFTRPRVKTIRRLLFRISIMIFVCVCGGGGGGGWSYQKRSLSVIIESDIYIQWRGDFPLLRRVITPTGHYSKINIVRITPKRNPIGCQNVSVETTPFVLANENSGNAHCVEIQTDKNKWMSSHSRFFVVANRICEKDFEMRTRYVKSANYNTRWFSTSSRNPITIWRKMKLISHFWINQKLLMFLKNNAARMMFPSHPDTKNTIFAKTEKY